MKVINKKRARKEAMGVFRYGIKGQGTFVNEVIKIAENLAPKLRQLSLTDLSDDEFSIPSDYKLPKYQRPKRTAALNLEPEHVKFVIELFVTWVGTKVLDDIWNTFKDSLSLKIFKRDASCELHITSTLDEVTLVLRFQAKDEKQLKDLKKLVPKVIEQAKKWATAKGITHNL